jgi:membrane protease YdiL (CAAX protease family)
VTASPLAGSYAPLKAIGWTLLFLATGTVLTVVLTIGGLYLAGDLIAPATAPRDLAIQTWAGLSGFGFLTWALGHRALGLSLRELRWSPLRRALPGFGMGIALGTVPALLVIGASLLLGGAGFTSDQGSVGLYLERVGGTALLLGPAALFEEIVFRGVGQVALARAFGRLPAILGLSLVFAAGHLGNPNTTVLGLANIALAGILLGVAFYLPGGIWTAWGAHLGWNLTLAAVDAPVSGLPFRIPLIDYVPGGPSWLTGGPFGPEGGVLATIVLVLAAGAAWRWSRKEMA